MTRGIYTVANNVVTNQLRSFLNSFKVNWPHHYPICVIPYNDNYDEVVKIVADYENVIVFNDIAVLRQLDIFMGNLWMDCSEVVKEWKSKGKHVPHRLGEHRRFVALTEFGLFDEFIYLDVDTYINRNMSELLDMLQHFEVVAHDFQHEGPEHVFTIGSLRLEKILAGHILDQIQCTGLIITRKNLFSKQQWMELPKQMREDQEVLYAWAPDQTLWNYMINKNQVKFVNLTRYWTPEQITHDSQTFTKFEFRDGKIYEEGRPIFYFHHIGVPSSEFNRLCNRKKPMNNFRYQEIFLWFRYWNDRKNCPIPNLYG